MEVSLFQHCFIVFRCTTSLKKKALSRYFFNRASYIELIGRLTFIPFDVPLAAKHDICFADFAVLVHGARVFASKRAWIASTPLIVPMAARICGAER